MTTSSDLDLAVELAGGGKRSLVLRNPVMTASGTFSNGLEFAKVFDIQRLGAIVTMPQFNMVTDTFDHALIAA